jgi:hypothetical protein
VANNAYQGYWKIFGGVWSLLRSTYFWIALILTLLSQPLWIERYNNPPGWVDIATGVIPNLLGFALGGMAIMLSFSSGRFLEAIRQSGREDSYFMKMIASFFHFSIVLTCSLLIAILSRSLHHEILSFAGVACLFYGILLVPATAASIWHTARVFNAAIEPKNDD